MYTLTNQWRNERMVGYNIHVHVNTSKKTGSGWVVCRKLRRSRVCHTYSSRRLPYRAAAGNDAFFSFPFSFIPLFLHFIPFFWVFLTLSRMHRQSYSRHSAASRRLGNWLVPTGWRSKSWKVTRKNKFKSKRFGPLLRPMAKVKKIFN